MTVEFDNLTAYCGIYCGDCIHYRNSHSQLASELRNKLEQVDFARYAEIKSPFGKEFEHYPQFMKVLQALINSYCHQPCRVGGGCSTGACTIMQCCLVKGFKGCWECDRFEKCELFKVLEPRCGDMPLHNLRMIRKVGLVNWFQYRKKFYIWL